ncbi:limbic system-associated membrane protein-like isoform X2 [Liolophura sinensis]|uniref:limbic system-associated membrane protein-like isoform X2 n=1 Tax=Liolophura sinensis TaxID=3198878 RepID=UPI0031591613
MWTLLQLAVCLCALGVCVVFARDPDFDVPVINVTITAGMTAVLPCSVNNLGNHLVIWTNPKAVLLTFENKRTTDDDRISINRPYIKEWNLHIRDVKYSDQGEYTCQINTDPVKTKKVYLHVQVPSAIIDQLSSSDMVAEEGDTVMLVCNVTGVPHPEVTWFRLPTQAGTQKEKIGVSGEILIIHNVSRFCDDVYECVAYNGVPPAVNRQIRVTVQFPPEIQLPNRRIGQVRGRETILECIITAYPHTLNYWKRFGEEIENNDKYQVDVYEEGEDTLTLSLRIRSLQEEDYGKYTCVSINPVGSDEETMYLYERKKIKTTTTTMSTIPSTHSKATQPDLVTWRPPSKVPTDPHKQPGNQGYLPGEHGEKDLNRGEIDIVTKGLSRETPPQNDQHPGKSGEKMESKGNLANKGAYACIFIVVFLSALTSICVWKRT